MKISTWFYSLKQGLKSIYRNRLFSLASIGTITACLFLFGIFYFVVANFRYMIDAAEKTVGVTVFFDEGISEEEIKAIGEQIKIKQEVDRIEYLSAEESWEIYKEKYLTEELAETFGEDNPLEDSASYTVYLNDVSKQGEVVTFIENIHGVRKVNNSESFATGLTGFNVLVGYVTSAIIIILLGVAVFLISTTVTMGISVRKEEIYIMKLIGATDYFVRAPFIVEGVLIGCMGSLLPIGVLYLLYGKVTEFIGEKFSSTFGAMNFLSRGEIFSNLIPISVVIGVGIGFLGSYYTLRKHIKKANH